MTSRSLIPASNLCQVWSCREPRAGRTSCLPAPRQAPDSSTAHPSPTSTRATRLGHHVPATGSLFIVHMRQTLHPTSQERQGHSQNRQRYSLCGARKKPYFSPVNSGRTRYPIDTAECVFAAAGEAGERHQQDRSLERRLQSDGDKHRICSQTDQRPSLRSRFCVPVNLTYDGNLGGGSCRSRSQGTPQGGDFGHRAEHREGNRRAGAWRASRAAGRGRTLRPRPEAGPLRQTSAHQDKPHVLRDSRS